MGESLKLLEIFLVFGGVMAFAAWEVWKIDREQKRDRGKRDETAEDADPEGESGSPDTTSGTEEEGPKVD